MMQTIRRLLQILLLALVPALATAQTTTSIWTFVTSEPILTSPSVNPDGTIYVGSYDRKLYSIRPDGTTNWSFEMPGTNMIGFVYRGIHSSPALGPDGTIYFGGEDGFFYALDPVTGTNRWAFDVAPKSSPIGGTRFSAIYSDPAVDSDGIIYIGSYVVDGVGTLRTSQSQLLALNPDGTLHWQYKPASTIFSDPVIAADGTVYFGCDDQNLYALNPDGSLRWTFPTGGPVTASPAIGEDGAVYVGSTSSGTFYAVNTNGTERWHYIAGAAIHSSAAIGADGTLYFGADDTNVHALNPDGTLKWTAPLGDKVRSSPALGIDGTLYVGCHDGNLYALDASGSNVWSFGTTNYVYSSPAIMSDGTVLVASADKNLYAIPGSTGLADAVWPMFRYDLQRTGTVTGDNGEVPVPIIQSIAPVEDGFEVIWSSNPGSNYRLLFRTDWSASVWEKLPGDVQATNTSASKIDSTATNQHRLYRVMALP